MVSNCTLRNYKFGGKEVENSVVIKLSPFFRTEDAEAVSSGRDGSEKDGGGLTFVFLDIYLGIGCAEITKS